MTARRLAGGPLCLALLAGGAAACGTSPLDVVALDPSNLARDLVAHWAFDDGMGTQVTDSSGNGHDGLLSGGTWLAQGRFGGALYLASGDSVSIAGFPPATASWTVSVWTKSSATDLAASTNDLSTIISTEVVFAGGWQVHLDNRPGYNRFDAAYWSGPNTTDYVVASCACIEADRWIHLTTVWDAPRSKVTLYRDGAAVDELQMPAPIQTGDSTVWIGRWTEANRFLVGAVDDFAVWARALEPGEIAALSLQPPG